MLPVYHLPCSIGVVWFFFFAKLLPGEVLSLRRTVAVLSLSGRARSWDKSQLRHGFQMTRFTDHHRRHASAYACEAL